VLFPLVLGAHLLVFFAGQWSLAVHCAVSLMPADALGDASLARVQPAPHSGSEALVPLQFNEESALSANAAVEAPCCPVAGALRGHLHFPTRHLLRFGGWRCC